MWGNGTRCNFVGKLNKSLISMCSDAEILLRASDEMVLYYRFKYCNRLEWFINTFKNHENVMLTSLYFINPIRSEGKILVSSVLWYALTPWAPDSGAFKVLVTFDFSAQCPSPSEMAVLMTVCYDHWVTPDLIIIPINSSPSLLFKFMVFYKNAKIRGQRQLRGIQYQVH